MVRGLLTRVRGREFAEAARVVQRVCHGKLLRMKTQREQKAIVEIQAGVRAMLSRKELALKHKVARAIQTHLRRRRALARLEKEDRASAVLAARWKGYVMLRKKKFGKRVQCMQANFRGVASRRSLIVYPR